MYMSNHIMYLYWPNQLALIKLRRKRRWNLHEYFAHPLTQLGSQMPMAEAYFQPIYLHSHN